MAALSAPSTIRFRAALFDFSSSVKSKGTISNINTSKPILAHCAAMPEPIRPEPKTATLRMCLLAVLVALSVSAGARTSFPSMVYDFKI